MPRYCMCRGRASDDALQRQPVRRGATLARWAKDDNDAMRSVRNLGQTCAPEYGPKSYEHAPLPFSLLYMLLVVPADVWTGPDCILLRSKGDKAGGANHSQPASLTRWLFACLGVPGALSIG